MTRSRKARAGILGLAAALLLAAPVGAAEADKYLPEDTTTVASVNVRQVLDSPVGKKYLQEVLKTVLKQNANFQKVLAAAGVDPLKDVSGLVVATSAVDGDKVLVIAHGTFDPDKTQAAAAEFAKKNPRQMAITKEGDLRVIEARGDGQAMYAVFVDKETALLSLSKKGVVEAAKAGGKGPPKLKKEMEALVEKADAKKAVWAVALAPEEMKKSLSANPNTTDIADKIEGFTGDVDVDKDVQVALTIRTADAKTAEAIGEALDSFKNFAKLAAQNNAQFGKLLGDLVDNLTIAPDKSVVNLNVKVTEEMIDKAVKPAPAKAPPKKP